MNLKWTPFEINSSAAIPDWIIHCAVLAIVAAVGIILFLTTGDAPPQKMNYVLVGKSRGAVQEPLAAVSPEQPESKEQTVSKQLPAQKSMPVSLAGGEADETKRSAPSGLSSFRAYQDMERTQREQTKAKVIARETIPTPARETTVSPDGERAGVGTIPKSSLPAQQTARPEGEKPEAKNETPSVIETKIPSVKTHVVDQAVERVNVLESIRKDPRRIYLDKTFTTGDLSFTIRNISEFGVEIYLKVDPDARNVYYWPKVVAAGQTSQFDGNVLYPGQNAFGWIIVPNIRNMESLALEFSAAGTKPTKGRVKLKW